MVLFKEDDIALKEQKKKEKSRLRKWWDRIFWTCFVVGGLLFAGLTILSNFGGQNPVVQKAFEDYLSSMSGFKTSLTDFNYMGFYPDVTLDFDNVLMKDNGQNIKIGSFEASIDFWRITFRSLVFKRFLVEDVSIPAGVVAPRAIKIEELGFVLDEKRIEDRLRELDEEMQAKAEQAEVEEEAQEQEVSEGDLAAAEQTQTKESEVAVTAEPTPDEAKQSELRERMKLFGYLTQDDFKADFALRGTYGNYPVHMAMGAEVILRSKARVEYKLPKQGPFHMTFGEFKAEGRYTREFGSFTFQFDEGGIADNKVSGSIKPFWSDKKHGAEGFLVSGGSRLNFDIEQTPFEMTGDVSFETLDFKDLQAPLKIFEEIALYIDDPKNEEELKASQTAPITLVKAPVNLDVAVKKLKRSGNNIGHIHFPLEIKSDELKLGPIDGKLAGGNLSGNLHLKSDDAALWVLNSEGVWKGWNYATFQGYSEGKALADMSWSLSGQGQNWFEIKSSYNGHATVIAGQGKMPSKALNVWGAGLFNALLPSLDAESETDLNCMIADMRIEKGIATPSPLFLDTKRVTVMGEGSYNIVEDDLKLTFEPQSKNTALFDVAPAVNVKGSITAPSVGVSTTSVITKVGGLALGAINPAFLVVTMTDLGLGDNHPCREFIGHDDDKTSVKTPPETEKSAEEQKADELKRATGNE